ncbi:MAG: hypothetical protein JNL30_14085 [Rubrivivax sp.]|nr:hypothetical protein [Rubrivivax sp.]
MLMRPFHPLPALHRLRTAPAGMSASIALAGAALLAGCASEPQRLLLRDPGTHDAAFQAALRPLAWARAGRGPSRGFEAGYQQYQAEGPQALAAGQSVTVGAQSIPGPDTLLQKAKVVAWHFGYTDRLYAGPSFEFDFSGGGMKLDVDYELRPQSGALGTQPFARSNTLPYGSITPRWRFGPMLAVEARLAVAGFTDRAEHHRHEAALVLSPLPPVALRLGYAWQRTSIASWSDPLFDNVDLRIRARGPAASLRLEF